MSLSFRFATESDLPLVVDLVNQAYRGDENYPGWTHEGHLLHGARISLQQLLQQLQDEHAQMLLAERQGNLCGCMMLSLQSGQVYLGTFAVMPHMQGNGIGRQMLQHAEWLAVNQWQVSQMGMVVISQRQDLIAYYQRRGYQLNNDVSDFPVELNVGVPKIKGLTITGLSKSL